MKESIVHQLKNRIWYLQIGGELMNPLPTVSPCVGMFCGNILEESGQLEYRLVLITEDGMNR